MFIRKQSAECVKELRCYFARENAEDRDGLFWKAVWPVVAGLLAWFYAARTDLPAYSHFLQFRGIASELPGHQGDGRERHLPRSLSHGSQHEDSISHQFLRPCPACSVGRCSALCLPQQLLWPRRGFCRSVLPRATCRAVLSDPQWLMPSCLLT